MVSTLDHFLQTRNIQEIDFLKIDVEGAELDVFTGGKRLFSLRKRPVILAEVSDVRTAPWNYRAKEILELVKKADYEWFEISSNGALLPANMQCETYDCNLVAVPRERKKEITESLAS
ncbi:MAG: hypothetical protein PVS2B2_03770 [Candidatus Acidiferrum sp.]